LRRELKQAVMAMKAADPKALQLRPEDL